MISKYRTNVDRMLRAVHMLRRITGNGELQAQAVIMFLFIAAKLPAAMSVGEIEKALALDAPPTKQNRVNVPDRTRRPITYKLIHNYFDLYTRRMVCTLTPRGRQLAAALARIIDTAA